VVKLDKWQYCEILIFYIQKFGVGKTLNNFERSLSSSGLHLVIKIAGFQSRDDYGAVYTWPLCAFSQIG